MPHTAESIRTSSNDRLKTEVIEPWVVALASADAFLAAPEAVRAIVCLWTLHARSAGEGIAAFVAATPPVVGDFVPEAARILDVPLVAERWSRATAGMDRAAQHGVALSEVTWGDRLEAEQLEDELVCLHPTDVQRHVLRHLRARADELAALTRERGPA
ncbi:MAG: hypothetical protein M3Y87_23355 [Myxococcota bacterium]|nr:hypothetical protein [Myxococcota bacterium]